MKAESTIRRQIRRLRKVAEDEQQPQQICTIAYEAYHALRWVIEDVAWTPYGEIRAKCINVGWQEEATSDD